MALLYQILAPGPKYFPEEMMIDQSERWIVQELIREKVLVLLHDEVPHGIAVEVMSMKPRKNKDIIDLEATVYCEKKSHKGILIGKNGAMLKKIGSLARQDIEFFLKTHVNLQLWVKVRNDWREKNYDLKELGYYE
jgi:GTP-binding protein Era